jgi:mannose-1-phosphate guanylyltransferase
MMKLLFIDKNRRTPVILPVILAGGMGDRLWPLSRSTCPKQFLALNDKQSLLQTTIQRIPKTDNYYPPIILCNQDHRFLVAEQLRELNIKSSAIILETATNNTAPAIAIAAHWAMKNLPNALLLVLPADHILDESQKFFNCIETAVEVAKSDYLVTFGVKPTEPETAYGYIEPGNVLMHQACHIKKFIEKPDYDTAVELVSSQKYLWNSGIFLFKPKSYLSELEKFNHDVYSTTAASFAQTKKDLDFIRPNSKFYNASPKISIDHAVMEKTTFAAVVPLRSKWSDIGSWNTLWEESIKDENGNVIKGNVVTGQTDHCLIHANHRLVATLGVKNLIIVETNDALLIAKQSQSQNIKDLVLQLKEQKAIEATQHTKVSRPWGWFEVITKSDNYQVKLLTVHPQKKLSLQLHKHRSEHWVVVQGQAKVTRGNETFYLSANESTYIPAGTKHRLENTGKSNLGIIEVQSGDYLGEDDIIRFNDEYGRETINEQLYEKT